MRAIAAILLALIVAVEAYLMLSYRPPTKGFEFNRDGQREFKQQRLVELNNQKYALLIGATILVGGIVVFSLPKGKK